MSSVSTSSDAHTVAHAGTGEHGGGRFTTRSVRPGESVARHPGDVALGRDNAARNGCVMASRGETWKMARGQVDRPWNRPPGLALPVLMSAFAIGASVLGMPPGAAATPPIVEAAASSPAATALGPAARRRRRCSPRGPSRAGHCHRGPTVTHAGAFAVVPHPPRHPRQSHNPRRLGPWPRGRTVVVAGPWSIPAMVLDAYQRAANVLSHTEPRCKLSWQLLAGIGRIESNHAWFGELAADGTTLRRIVGPALDGAPGMAAVHDTDNGRWDGDRAWDHAVGPMQFLPSTWSVLGRDGGGDGRADPNNVYDATLSAGHYLCAHDRDLTDPADLYAAVFSYNHSDAYVAAVLAWDRAYTTGDVTPSAGRAPPRCRTHRGSPESSPRPVTHTHAEQVTGANRCRRRPRDRSAQPLATPTPTPTPSPSTSPTPSESPVPAGCPSLSPTVPLASPSMTPSASPTLSPAPSPTTAPSTGPTSSTPLLRRLRLSVPAAAHLPTCRRRRRRPSRPSAVPTSPSSRRRPHQRRLRTPSTSPTGVSTVQWTRARFPHRRIGHDNVCCRAQPQSSDARWLAHDQRDGGPVHE